MNTEPVSGRRDFTLGDTSPNRQRHLKIERLGDSWRGNIHSGIRLKGQWLSQAGFPPGERVSVSVMAPGVIELRLVPQSTPAESETTRLRIAEAIDNAIAGATRSQMESPAI